MTSVEEAFRTSRNIEFYFEIWESSKNTTDPLIKEWKEHIKKKTEKTKL